MQRWLTLFQKILITFDLPPHPPTSPLLPFAGPKHLTGFTTNYFHSFVRLISFFFFSLSFFLFALVWFFWRVSRFRRWYSRRVTCQEIYVSRERKPNARRLQFLSAAPVPRLILPDNRIRFYWNAFELNLQKLRVGNRTGNYRGDSTSRSRRRR